VHIRRLNPVPVRGLNRRAREQPGDLRFPPRQGASLLMGCHAIPHQEDRIRKAIAVPSPVAQEEFLRKL
jgi:hypothetical protein